MMMMMMINVAVFYYLLVYLCNVRAIGLTHTLFHRLFLEKFKRTHSLKSDDFFTNRFSS